MPAENPLFPDREIRFVLHELLPLEGLLGLSAFAHHDREGIDLFVESARRLAREHLYPAYRPMDQEPARLENGRVTVHPLMHELWPRLVDLGVLSATRPESVDGLALPLCASTCAHLYLMAGNLSAFGYVGLTTGAAHLIETFGDERTRTSFMQPMYAGRYAGTMALTEPQAGSSLADVTTSATLRSDGTYSIRGSKIFISGGDQDVTENVVHLTLARIAGAPPGTKGISLFAIPLRRPTEGGLIDNDVHTTGLIHKIGWRGLPSLALNFGERGDCVGWLIGEPHKGLAQMFQMMNEARIMVGLNGVATAAVAYQESLAYAKERTQGRELGNKDPSNPPVPIIEHPDVRRMLLRQKAIVEGGTALVATTAWYADRSEHAEAVAERSRARAVLDVLTPIAKSFPAERGFESNTLALQILGGYGYTSEYPVEAWLRDQKLNSIHEGTTSIQGLDLLGRRVMQNDGAGLRALAADVEADVVRARAAGVESAWCDALGRAMADVGKTTTELGARGLAEGPESMLAHSADYLEACSTVVVAWQWIKMAGLAAAAGPDPGSEDEHFYAGKHAAAQYWIETELPRAAAALALCRAGESSYLRAKPEWF